ncbi:MULTISPECIES: hypothetical protein [unclassified Serratia (in: enterobacteria)]|uniref:hypothetical protein n=1 Tax=unclassified Serratia (in: enterobacteria) TaxID=2647522 RepID=UPI002ED40958|nr:hypothetical protein [Serratia sp. C2(2)]MEE4449343.1 hypothetical protein [Serratia sp. C2(1)]
MKELDNISLTKVSGGAFNFKESAEGLIKFLKSDKNPLSGQNLGAMVGGLGVSVMLSFIDAFITPWLKNKS